MENDIIKKVPDLIRLLETTDFEDLTAAEKADIIRYWTTEAYDHSRESVISGKAAFESEKKKIWVRPEIRELLLKRMEYSTPDTRKALSTLIKKLFTFRIPVYQPGFAIVVLIILFTWLHDKTPETIRYLSRVDTVFLEKEPTSVNLLPETNPPRRATDLKENAEEARVGNKQSLISVRDNKSLPNNDIQNVYHKISLVKRTPSGSSASNDSVLLKFLVSAN